MAPARLLFRLPLAWFGCLLVALLPSCGRPAAQSAASGGDCLVYVGTNVASAQDATVFLYRLSAATGALTRVGAYRGGAKPTYLALAADRRFLYAVSETDTFGGARGGGVSALAVAPRTGALTLLGQQPSAGAGPCYLSLDRTGQAALVANYGGGSVALLPVRADGQLAAPTATAQHQGAGPHPNQAGPHAHCLLPDPANAHAFAVDLGTDQVIGYRLDPAAGQLARLPGPPAFQARPGAGPRHLVFHPNGRWAYLVNELNSTVTALAYDAAAGRFQELQTLSALPAGYAGPNSGADLHLAPSGRFLYTSNRGHNSIAVFAVDAERGTLALVQHQSTLGDKPRNFALTPSGQLLLVANQNSNSLVSFRVEAQTGRLAPTGQSAAGVPTPMFVAVVEDFTR